jgi:4-amino-4-deoxy-L-arabinose transferase-like glycosyltransferase
VAGVDLAAHGGDLVEAAQLNAWRWAILVTIVAGLVRLIVGALTPLFPDETYYWEWSRRLATGYFDHPPMIAWLIRAGTSVAGDTPLGVRLGPVVAGTVGALFVAATARRLADDRAGLIAALVFATMPLSAAGLVLATPDAPLLAFAAASVYAIVRALESPARSGPAMRWWSAAGLALALAMTSKYTAVLLPLGVFVAMLARRELRVRLAEPGPYVATAIALFVFHPVIIWNRHENWASFGFQVQHGLGAVGGSVIRRELDLIGGQLGLVSPILFVLIAIALARGLRSAALPLPSLLSLLSLFVFTFFIYSAAKRRVEANWPALAYIPGVVILAARARSRTWDRWLRGGIVLSALLSVVAYVNSFTPILPVPARRDPVARSAGWEDAATAVNRIHATRLPLSSYRTWVGADRYQEASALAFHLPDHPQTFALNLTTRPNQYDLWPRFTDRAQPRDGLILLVDEVTAEHATVALLAPHFATVNKGELVTLARAGDPVKQLRIWVLDGWRGTWPERPLRSRS